MTRSTLTETLAVLTANQPDLFFVQVGSNDGLQGDPIHDLIVTNKTWSGLFIEPVGFVFERLKKNYESDTRFIFENVAIGSAIGRRTFWYLANALAAAAPHDRPLDPVPYWFDQLGSFDRNHILKHFPGRESSIEPFIVEEEVAVLPLDAVLRRHHVHRMDLVHVDTEGFDYQVLQQIDFARYRPGLVLYEHAHLSAADRVGARLFMSARDYHCQRIGPDTLAVDSRRTAGARPAQLD